MDSGPLIYSSKNPIIEKLYLSMKDENKAFVIWFTGLSGSGKSTLADIVFENIKTRGMPVEKLDGDQVRKIFPSTGFSKEERDRHIKRIGFTASLLEKHGVIVIASFVSPYRQARRFVRQLCTNFIEVYVRASIEACHQRDVKGLYKKVQAGEIKEFTGVDDPYEEPQNPEVVVDTESQTPEESAAIIIDYIESYLKGS